MRVVILLPLGVEGGGGAEIWGKGEVFVKEGLHVRDGFGKGFVTKGTGFEFGKDCMVSASLHTYVSGRHVDTALSRRKTVRTYSSIDQ